MLIFISFAVERGQLVGQMRCIRDAASDPSCCPACGFRPASENGNNSEGRPRRRGEKRRRMVVLNDDDDGDDDDNNGGAEHVVCCDPVEIKE